MKLTMKLAPLLAAAILVATAPSASALTCAGRTCVDTQLPAEVTDEAIGLAVGALGIVLGVAQQQTADLDHDGVPDAAEPILCGNQFVVLLVNGDTVPGHCASATDYQPPDNLADLLETVGDASEFVMARAEEARAEIERQAADVQARIDATVLFVEGQVQGLIDQVDPDHDGVPNVLEPIICGFVENSGVQQDGSCVGDDYTPWSP